MNLIFPPFEPKAKSHGDQITPKQIGFATVLARDLGGDAEEEARRHYGCELSECSKDAGSRLIDHLKNGDYLPIVKDGIVEGVVAEVEPAPGGFVIRPAAGGAE